MNYVARVGVILVVGLGLLGGTIYVLQGHYAQRNSYRITVVFDNALGVQVGAKVRMAGVDIGTVGHPIQLTRDNRAQLRLNIDRQYGIPLGSRFTIATSTLIGEKFVDILPGPSSETMPMDGSAIVEGPDSIQPPFQIEKVGAEVSDLLTEFQEVSGNLNRILGDPAMHHGLVQAITNLARTTARAEQLMLAAQTTMLRNQGQVDRAMANMVEASAQLRDAMTDVHALTNRPEVQTSVVETAEALRSASERLDAVVQDVREITGDPEVARNLRETAENLSEATAHARDVGERVGRFLGTVRPQITVNVPRPKFQSGTRLMLESAGSGSGDVRTDLVLTVPTSDVAGIRLGLYDFTGSNQVIAQRINWLDPQTATRYGIFGGRIGVGMDYEASRRLALTADLYDPKFPTLDLRGRYYYSNDFGLVFGVDGILRQPRAVLGIQWRK